jgi:hypothetical protein
MYIQQVKNEDKPKEMEYDAGVDDTEVVIETEPMYNVSAWRTHAKGGKQCSQSRDFCYLCTHRSFGNERVLDENDEEVPDYHEMITNVIRTLSAEGSEVSTIVRTVFDMYNDNVRKEINWYNPITKLNIKEPTWNMASIERHIIYSGICPELHDRVVDHIFHGIIDSHNKHMMNRMSGRVIESERKAFMDTMKNFTSWRKFRSGCGKFK